MPKVTIYSTATCVYCRAEKAFFDEHEVPYESVAVDEDPVKAEELLQLSGGLSVPFTVIKHDDGAEEKILGFDEHRIASALGIAGHEHDQAA